MSIYLSLLSAAILGTSANATQTATELSDLNGRWVPKSAILGGQPMPEPVLAGMSLQINDGSYLVNVAGQLDRGELSVQADANPPRMEIISRAGPTAGSRFRAIYRIDGDRLLICYDLSGQDYPKEFSSTAGTQEYLVDYVRDQSEAEQSTPEG